MALRGRGHVSRALRDISNTVPAAGGGGGGGGGGDKGGVKVRKRLRAEPSKLEEEAAGQPKIRIRLDGGGAGAVSQQLAVLRQQLSAEAKAAPAGEGRPPKLSEPPDDLLLCEEGSEALEEPGEEALAAAVAEAARPRVDPCPRGLNAGTSMMPFLEDSLDPFEPSGGVRSNEGKHALAPYLSEGSRRFNAGTRQLVVDWAFSRQLELELVDETVHLAVRYVDTFLRMRGANAFLARHSTSEEALAESGGGEGLPGAHGLAGEGDAPAQPPSFPCKLRRLMATALFVAGKLVESSDDVPCAKDFARAARATGFYSAEIIAAEKALLEVLKYNLHMPTPSSFGALYAEAAGASSQQHRVVIYVLDLALMAHRMLEYPPSLLAAAAVRLVVGPSSSSALEKLGGYGAEELAGAGALLEGLWRDGRGRGEALAVNTKHYRAIREEELPVPRIGGEGTGWRRQSYAWRCTSK